MSQPNAKARNLTTAVQPFLERLEVLLRRLAESDPEFRRQLHEFGESLCALAGAAAPAEAEPVVEPPPLPTAAAPAAAPGPSIHELAAKLWVAPPEPAVAAPAMPSTAPTVDFGVVAARCRLKADAARWAARSPVADGGADREGLISQARALPDCFLWMCSGHDSRAAPVAYETLAGCYEAASAAADFARDLDTEPAVDFDRVLDLIAEVQSGLYAALAAVGGDRDPDQLQLYGWVKDAAWNRRHYIERYMKAGDPADPTAWADRLDRLRQFGDEARAGRRRAKQRREGLKKIAFHVRRIRDASSADHAADWATVLRTVDELVADGLPPSSADLRDLLLPVLDEFPEDEVGRNVGLVLRELDRAAAEPTIVAAPATVEPPTADVARARELLRGRSVVLIGGVARPGAGKALVEALDLKALDWITTREHQSHMAFEPAVADPDVAVVLLAIRWSSHGFGEVKQFCNQCGKPLVRLPAGYSPNQVAYHIVHQVGDRLAQAASRPEPVACP